MDPGSLIPIPDILPAPWGFFYLLLIITFALHLIAANIMVGGGIVALLSESMKKGNRADVPSAVAPRLPMTIALTVNLGVPPLLFLQVLYGQFIYVGSILMAVYWLSIFVLIILAYYSAYLYHFRFDRSGPSRVWLISLSIALMLLVGFFFTNSLLLMIDPKAWPTYFNHPEGRIIHAAEPTLIPRYLHFVIASVAMGGLAMGLLGWWRKRQGDPEGAARLSGWLRLFGWATFFQFIVGALYLGTLPNPVLAKVFFEYRAAMPVFVFSIGTGLASILFSFSEKPWHTAVTAFLTIFLMVVFRYNVRAAYMETYLSQYRPEVVTQVGPALMFVIALIVGADVVVWLLKLVFRTVKEPGS